MSRGALYHQFDDKQALFAAVVEAVEVEVTQRLGEIVVARAPTDPLDALRAGPPRGWRSPASRRCDGSC